MYLNVHGDTNKHPSSPCDLHDLQNSRQISDKFLRKKTILMAILLTSN